MTEEFHVFERTTGILQLCQNNFKFQTFLNDEEKYSKPAFKFGLKIIHKYFHHSNKYLILI